ncbi:hypothetical protein DAEQUDRAFT_765580 [Daedalea quercina L-15889]|uniref:Uncharacterized protein n=1 Tax=Daedalea quercina L-15889 TaxID=1314783 RepID=A0A165QC51_9APHY|nr:hypothetical protein DAEQUDRAFT_765580 [Daedalea quercina L-15889]
MSPARLGGQNQHPQPILQANDFPPLSSAPERRAPAVAGAWTNASSTRSIIMAGAQGSTTPQGNALVHYPNAQQPSATTPRMDDHESGFDRPPPKGNAELFNPKGTPRISAPTRMSPVEMTESSKQNGLTQGDTGSVVALVDKAESVTLEDRSTEIESVPSAAQNGASAAGAEGPENVGES